MAASKKNRQLIHHVGFLVLCIGYQCERQAHSSPVVYTEDSINQKFMLGEHAVAAYRPAGALDNHRRVAAVASCSSDTQWLVVVARRSCIPGAFEHSEESQVDLAVVGVAQLALLEIRLGSGHQHHSHP